MEQGNMPQRISRSTWRLIALLVSCGGGRDLRRHLHASGPPTWKGNRSTTGRGWNGPRRPWTTTGWRLRALEASGHDSAGHPDPVRRHVFPGAGLPVYVLPYIEERFELRLPQALPPMTGQALFYRYGPALDSLLEEFHRVNSPS